MVKKMEPSPAKQAIRYLLAHQTRSDAEPPRGTPREIQGILDLIVRADTHPHHDRGRCTAVSQQPD
ncbi:hypothetical protein AAMO2058_001017800, partial [Amorphochlora amoebiformis]